MAERWRRSSIWEPEVRRRAGALRREARSLLLQGAAIAIGSLFLGFQLRLEWDELVDLVFTIILPA